MTRMSSSHSSGKIGASTQLGAVVLLALAFGAGSSAQEATQQIESAKKSRLHALAAEGLRTDAEKRALNAEAEAIIEAVEELSRDLGAAEERPSDGRLRSVAVCRRRTEAALTALQARTAASSAEAVHQLASRFEPVWKDIDAALGAPPEQRREHLAAARTRLEEARSRRGDAHTTSIAIDSLGGQR